MVPTFPKTQVLVLYSVAGVTVTSSSLICTIFEPYWCNLQAILCVKKLNMHGKCLLSFKNDINLSARGYHFPCAFKTCGNDKLVTHIDSQLGAINIGYDARAFQNVAIFMLSIGDIPAANVTLPNTYIKLCTWASIMILHALQWVAFKSFFIR